MKHLMNNKTSPVVFITYDWKDENYKTWVRYLAESLVKNGVDVRLDQWHIKHGESIPKFMENGVRTSNYVIIVCTPEYAKKSNARRGCVGYEQQIISGMIASGADRSKFIPIIRRGSLKPGPDCAVPSHFFGISAIDFRDDSEMESKVEDLVRIFYSCPKYAPPPLGTRPRLETNDSTQPLLENRQDYNHKITYNNPETLDRETSFSHLGRLSNAEIHRLLNQYKQMVTFNPEDGDAYMNLGFCYLQLELSDLTIQNFKQAMDRMPENPEAYYYYALSLIRGRRPKTMSLKEVRKIEEYVKTAIQLDDRQSKYYYLAAIIKFDYYSENGLKIMPPTYDQLLHTAEEKDRDQWEVERLLNSILLRDQELISKIRRG